LERAENTMPTRVIANIEELKGLVGQEIGLSDWFQVSQALIDAFAEITQDRQWIHCDPARAKTESPFGGTIAHGFLTLALLTHLKMQAVKIDGIRKSLNYGFNRVRFTAPVLAGARLRLHSTLQSVADVPGGVEVAWAITVEIEGQPKPALVAEWLGRLYS
jgi:acyl dehydratase